MPQWEINIEQLTLLNKVGTGSFGEVFRARLWGTEIAVKTLKTEEFAVSQHTHSLDAQCTNDTYTQHDIICDIHSHLFHILFSPPRKFLKNWKKKYPSYHNFVTQMLFSILVHPQNLPMYVLLQNGVHVEVYMMYYMIIVYILMQR